MTTPFEYCKIQNSGSTEDPHVICYKGNDTAEPKYACVNTDNRKDLFGDGKHPGCFLCPTTGTKNEIANCSIDTYKDKPCGKWTDQDYDLPFYCDYARANTKDEDGNPLGISSQQFQDGVSSHMYPF